MKRKESFLHRTSICLFQDASTNSSPVFSSAENSFEKGKLVVRDFFLILQNLRCHVFSAIRPKGNICVLFCFLNRRSTCWWWFSLLSCFDRTPASQVWMKASTNWTALSHSLCRTSLCTDHTEVMSQHQLFSPVQLIKQMNVPGILMLERKLIKL